MINIFITVILIIIILFLLIYIISLENQIRSINKQIDIRIKENSKQPINLQLFNKSLNSLSSNFNKVLSIEENLRNQSIHHENKFKDMIANISHDLRTPLTAIKGYLQLLNKTDLDKKQETMLKTALNHTNSLEELISDFFELSLLEISKENLDIKKLNLTNIVTNNIVNYIYQFEEKDLSVNFNVEKPIYIYGDEKKINRIVQNLIKNCIIHSCGNIDVDIILAEKVVTLYFKNPIENHDSLNVNHLFDKFYIGDKSKNSSTGLGLSIVKLLAESMNAKAYAFLEDDILDIQIQFFNV